MVRIEKDYTFVGPDGAVGFPALFEGRRQLIVYRAFYGPEATPYTHLTLPTIYSV